MEKANPRIRYVEVGIKQVRKIKLYPLSIQDQMTLSDLVTEAFFAFFLTEDESRKEKTDAEILSFAIETVKINLGLILDLVTDPESEVSLKEIDNAQGSQIALAIVEMNYSNEETVKNVKSLFEKVKGLFASKRQPSMFAKNIQDTGSNIFSPKATEKAESPSAN